MKKMALWSALVTIFVVLASPALAQRFTAGIRGTVTAGEGGAAVPGAKVTARNPETGLTRTVVTNSEGAYNLGDLAVGVYEVTVVAAEFKTFVVENVELNVADIRQIDVHSRPARSRKRSLSPRRDVQVETIGAEVAGLVTGEQVRELPLNGRNFIELTHAHARRQRPRELRHQGQGADDRQRHCRSAAAGSPATCGRRRRQQQRRRLQPHHPGLPLGRLDRGVQDPPQQLRPRVRRRQRRRRST